MMNDTIKSKLFINGAGVASLVGIAAIGYIGVAKPIMTRERESVQLRQHAATLVAEASELDEKAGAWEERLNEYKAALGKVAITLEPTSKLNARLARITEIAQNEHLGLDKVEPGKATDQGGRTRIPIVLSGKGSATGCSKFLDAMHHQFPDIRIVSLDFQAGNSVNPASFSMRLLWYASPTTGAIEPPLQGSQPSENAPAPNGHAAANDSAGAQGDRR